MSYMLRIANEPLYSALEYFKYEPFTSETIRRVRNTIWALFPGIPYNIDIGYDYNGYIDIVLKFDSAEDITAFKLRYPV